MLGHLKIIVQIIINTSKIYTLKILIILGLSRTVVDYLVVTPVTKKKTREFQETFSPIERLHLVRIMTDRKLVLSICHLNKSFISDSYYDMRQLYLQSFRDSYGDQTGPEVAKGALFEFIAIVLE